MSVRENILSSLQAALEGISVINGYNYDVAYVTRSSTGLADIDLSKVPALMILDDGEELPESNIYTDRRATAKFFIVGVIKSQSAISTYFNNFLADVRKCFLAASLGSYIIYQRLGGLTVQTGDGVIVFAQQIEILYYYPEATP